MRNGCIHLIITLAAVFNISTGACAQQATGQPLQEDIMECYPYLNADGRYGYADKQLRMVIPAQYRAATPFTRTGYAVIKDEQMHDGVIDKAGTSVVPCRYKSTYLQVVSGRTLLRTERVYVNRWRFWEWRFLPGFSITGGSSDKRLFDTEVRRSHLKITVLESGQTLYTKRIRTGQTYSGYFDVSVLDEAHFLLGNKLYELKRGKTRLLARNIFGKTDGGALLQQQGNHFRLINRKGKPVPGPLYKQVDHLQTTIKGKPVFTRLTSNTHIKGCVARVFADPRGNQYVFPDFSKAFPLQMNAGIADDSPPADTVLQKALLVSGMPGTDRFIFRWYNRHTRHFEYPMVDVNGHWHTQPPPDNTFTVVTPGLNHIVWPAAATVIPPQALPAGWRIVDYRMLSPRLYEVTIRQDSQERMGLWDAEMRRWQWEPQYHYIRCLNFAKGYWTFQPDKEGRYGLYHLPTGRIVIPPRYHNMSANGMVSCYDNQRRYLRFYVDWETQSEYREQ